MNQSRWSQKIVDFFIICACIILRYNPFRHKVGLIKIGNPNAKSPVLVSGNYFHTVKKLINITKGHDCFILVVDSAGINVWCGAGVCDFNEHKIADIVNICELNKEVDHRRLIVPQLAAVGVDEDKLKKECGFSVSWGPANLYDIPEFLSSNLRVSDQMRIVRFAFRDRLSAAVGLYTAFLTPILIVWLLIDLASLPFLLGILFVNIFATAFYNYIPFVKYPSNNAVVVGIVTIVGFQVYNLFYPMAFDFLLFHTFAMFVISAFVAFDMVGSTPFYKTTIVHWLKTLTNRSLFQPTVTDNCTVCGMCKKVCPKGLFSIQSKKIVVDLNEECCECLACVKQCHANAIKNINAYYKHDIKSFTDIEHRIS